MIFIIWLLIFLIVNSVTDIRGREIYSLLSIVNFIVAFVIKWIMGKIFWSDMAEIAIITILLYGISILTKEAIGKGDVAVIANMFMLSGLAKTVEIVIISLFICSIVSIACVLLGKINIRSSLPFVPFLCFGNVVWMIFAM